MEASCNVHSENYYEVLGLTKKATETEIKKAYRKLAIQWHPDKNPNNLKEAEEVFKKIAEAYDCLSNVDKRVIYDKYGKEGLKQGGGSTGGSAGFSGFNSDFTFTRAEDIFKQFFGGRDPFANFFDEDPFFDHGFGFGRPQQQQQRSKQGGQKQMNMMRDPFGGFMDHDDHFGMMGGGFGGFPSMGGGFGGFGGGFDAFDNGFGGSSFTSFQQSSFQPSPGSTSVKTQTFIQNGQRVTKTEKTTVDSQGNVQTQVTEEITKGNGQREKRTYQLTNGNQTSSGGGSSKTKQLKNGKRQ